MALLSTQSDFQVTGNAETGAETIRKVRDSKPEVVLIDINIPVLNGIATTKQLLAENPDVKVIALSASSDQHSAQRMLRAGASGYLVRTCSFSEVCEAIRTVARGSRYVCRSVGEMLLDDYVGLLDGRQAESKDELTEREKEVVQLFAEGKSSREIADLLFININTVESHKRHIYDKLHIHSIAELTRYAIAHGIIPLNR